MNMVSFWYLNIPTAQALIGTGLGTVAVRYCCSRVLLLRGTLKPVLPCMWWNTGPRLKCLSVGFFASRAGMITNHWGSSMEFIFSSGEMTGCSVAISSWPVHTCLHVYHHLCLWKWLTHHWPSTTAACVVLLESSVTTDMLVIASEGTVLKCREAGWSWGWGYQSQCYEVKQWLI